MLEKHHWTLSSPSEFSQFSLPPLFDNIIFSLLHLLLLVLVLLLLLLLTLVAAAAALAVGDCLVLLLVFVSSVGDGVWLRRCRPLFNVRQVWRFKRSRRTSDGKRSEEQR